VRLTYQLAFLKPGIFPANAISRKAILDKPKNLMYPLGRPLNWQRFFNLTEEEFLGNWSSALKSPAAFRAARFSAYWATMRSLLRCLALIDVLAMK